MKFIVKLKWSTGSLNIMVDAPNVLKALELAMADSRVTEHKGDINYVWIQQGQF